MALSTDDKAAQLLLKKIEQLKRPEADESKADDPKYTEEVFASP